jgi:hypothetical protein
MVDSKEAPPPQGQNAAMTFAEYLLAEMRAASLRARLLSSEIDAIAVALSGGMVTADQALTLMAGVDLLRVIGEQSSDE